jgi:hypothetical protein
MACVRVETAFVLKDLLVRLVSKATLHLSTPAISTMAAALLMLTVSRITPTMPRVSARVAILVMVVCAMLTSMIHAQLVMALQMVAVMLKQRANVLGDLHTR